MSNITTLGGVQPPALPSGAKAPSRMKPPQSEVPPRTKAGKIDFVVSVEKAVQHGGPAALEKQPPSAKLPVTAPVEHQALLIQLAGRY